MTTSAEIRKEWDLNAERRHFQIASGRDISYREILVPTILNMVGSVSNLAGVDIGCGTGVLTRELALRGALMTGVDLSTNMIAIAKREMRPRGNPVFVVSSFEDFANTSPPRVFDFAIANMSFNCVVHLDSVIRGIAKLLKPGGYLVFAIAHPAFWNAYRRLEKPRSFDYHLPHSVSARFTISLDKRGLPGKTTYFHRPLESYFRLLRNARFVVTDLREPMPSPGVAKLYPAAWRLPRFLFCRARLEEK